MKVWVEWKLYQTVNYDAMPSPPNVFTTKENLIEFWKHVRFPADTVDWLFEHYAKCGIPVIDHEGYAAAEVEVDEYFVEKAKERAKEGMEVKQ